MELNKQHREALLNTLEKTKDSLNSRKSFLKLNTENKLNPLVEWDEIDIFLLQKQIELIEQSLINNEIDY
jgi:hypothetical protein